MGGLLLILLTAALAQEAAVPPEARRQASREMVEPEASGPRTGFDAFALFQARSTYNNLASTNPLLDGQVVGRLGGLNGVVVSTDQKAVFSEQRVNAFATYRPDVLGGKGGLSAAFEVDFAFGDSAYGTGGNVGGGFGADQVNLQTRRLHANWWPTLGSGHKMHVTAGLQFVSDSVNDPTATTPDGLLRSGGRMMFFASEAAGVQVHGGLSDDWGPRLSYRVGTFTLLEQAIALPDDVWLTMADVQVHPAYATSVGLHTWYLQDRSGGTGGALGMGPTSDLYEMQGGPSIDLYDGYPPPEGAPIDADIAWLGADAGYDPGLTHGPVGVHGTAILNVGRMYAPIVHDDDIFGVVADAEMRLRWAQGSGSIARVEVVYGSGGGVDPMRYGGPITGNAYGVAGALMPTHGALLLFPDARSINRMTGVVHDVSGAGLGLVGSSASIGYDPIPDRLTTTVGGALAWAADGSPFGTEINVGISGEPLLFCDVGLYAATVLPGSASRLDANPWTLYAAVDWLVF